MNGWFLLHKKIWENPRFYRKSSALTVWIWLLSHTNNNGIVTCGRKQISQDTGVEENTVRFLIYSFSQDYQSDAPLLTIKPTNKFSIITILNWNKYQHLLNSTLNNNSTTTKQQLTTNKQYNNKEYIYKHLKITKDEFTALKEKYPLKEVDKECEKADNWLAAKGKTYKNYSAFMRNWLIDKPDNKKTNGSWVVGWGKQK